MVHVHVNTIYIHHVHTVLTVLQCTIHRGLPIWYSVFWQVPYIVLQVSCTQCGKNFTSEEEKNGHTCSRKVQVIASYNEKDNRVLGTEIPIFTPEFLAHTKG